MKVNHCGVSITAFKAGKFCFVMAVDNFSQAVRLSIKFMRHNRCTQAKVHVGMRLVWQRG